MMKNAKMIGNIGQILMVLGSALYLAELVWLKTEALTALISAIYAVALVLMLIGWVGTKDERKAAKEAAAREKAQEKARKAA